MKTGRQNQKREFWRALESEFIRAAGDRIAVKAKVSVDGGEVLAFNDWGELVTHLEKVGRSSVKLPLDITVGGTKAKLVATGPGGTMVSREPEAPGEFEEI